MESAISRNDGVSRDAFASHLAAACARSCCLEAGTRRAHYPVGALVSSERESIAVDTVAGSAIESVPALALNPPQLSTQIGSVAR